MWTAEHKLNGCLTAPVPEWSNLRWPSPPRVITRSHHLRCVEDPAREALLCLAGGYVPRRGRGLACMLNTTYPDARAMAVCARPTIFSAAGLRHPARLSMSGTGPPFRLNEGGENRLVTLVDGQPRCLSMTRRVAVEAADKVSQVR